MYEQEKTKNYAGRRMRNNKKKWNVKTNIILLVFCLSIPFLLTIRADAKETIGPHRNTGISDSEPFMYDVETKEYTLTIEKGAVIELASYIRYEEPAGRYVSKLNKSIDKLKGNKEFYIEDPKIASLTQTGTLIAQNVGKTYVEVTYQEMKFRFAVSVKETGKTQNKDIIKLKAAIAKFNQSVKSKKSITRKNRRKILSQLSAVRTIEIRLDKNNEGNTYRKGVYKGVCVIPDYSAFEKRLLWFGEYCEKLDPTNPKGKCPFKATKAVYEDGKIKIWLKKPITEDQLFGFKTNSELEEDNPMWWDSDRTWCSYFTGKKSKFKKAVTYITFTRDEDDEAAKTRYRARGIIKVGTKEIVMTPCFSKPAKPKQYEIAQLQPGTYRFWYKVPGPGPKTASYEKWLKKLCFEVY